MAEPFSLPPLPYAEGALAPVISAQTLSFHYGKHHKTYVDTLNKLVAGTEFEGQSLESIIRATAGKADKAPVFNNAAQIWNHTFYWHSLKPGGGGKPPSALAQKIDAAEVPFTKGQTPLLTIDEWEHAYYLDYQNKRVDYANAVVDKLLNWDFATKNLA